MIFNSLDIEVRSVYPLHYFDNESGDIHTLPNTFSDEEVVRVFDDSGKYIDLPIIGEMIAVPTKGIVLFRKEENAIRFNGLIADDKRINMLIENNSWWSKNDHNKVIKTGKNFIPGIYTRREYLSNLRDDSISECRYIGSDNLTKRIKITDDDPVINENIDDYLKLVNVDKNYVECDRELLCFDISNDGYIRHFVISSITCGSKPFMFSPLNGYPLFNSKRNAQMYRYLCNNNAVDAGVFENISRRQNEMTEKLRNDENTVNVVTTFLNQFAMVGKSISESNLIPESTINGAKSKIRSKINDRRQTKEKSYVPNTKIFTLDDSNNETPVIL